mgnify:CR=1 FL=1
MQVEYTVNLQGEKIVSFEVCKDIIAISTEQVYLRWVC